MFPLKNLACKGLKWVAVTQLTLQDARIVIQLKTTRCHASFPTTAFDSFVSQAADNCVNGGLSQTLT